MNICLFFFVAILHSTIENADSHSVEECIKKWQTAEGAKYFTADQINHLCQETHDWNERASVASAARGLGPSVDKVLTTKQKAFWNKRINCQGDECVKNITNVTDTDDDADADTDADADDARRLVSKQGVKRDKRAVRKEYRTLTDKQRRRYHAAIRKLKGVATDGSSDYDAIVHIHIPEIAPGAHYGATLLPFHRELIKHYELALREIDPSVALAYFDSRLDNYLPNPIDSIIWSNEFLGTPTGKVVDGPFANWPAPEIKEYPGVPFLCRNVLNTSDVYANRSGSFFDDWVLGFVLNRTKFIDFSICKDPTFDGAHGLVHLAIGGHMHNHTTSPNDPVFFMHHAFVDYLWEQFRQKRQTPQQRENDYPIELTCEHYEFTLPNATMRPFAIKNIDGLSNKYTREIYRYEKPPKCNKDRSGCIPKSPYLFCDKRENRCLSKIRINGNCTGFERQDICYGSKCVNGLCVKK